MKTHQSLFQYLLFWHKHVQYMVVPDDWGDPIPWCFWSIFGLWPFSRTRNSWYNTENDNNFPKSQRVIFGYIYTKITQTIFFRVFHHRCRAYLKLSANFANISGESSSRILADRAFHLNSEWNPPILFHWVIISSSNHRD